MRLDDHTAGIRPGAFAFVPASTVNAVRTGSEAARLLLFHLPGGLDKAIAHADGAADNWPSDYLGLIGSRTIAATVSW